MILIGFLMGCLPQAAPFRCDLAGGDRACDGVAGSRCIDGSCAAPVSPSVCASGLVFSASAASPGRCVVLADRDAAIDATARDDGAATDLPKIDAPSSLDEVVDRRDSAPSLDVPSPIDAPAVTDAPIVMDHSLASDAPGTDRSDPLQDVTATDVPRDGGAPGVETPPAAVAQVVGGFFHTCARLVDNRVWCWGSNGQGQLGINHSTPYVPTPTQLNLTDVVDVAAGAFHTCARTLNGEVFCWGRNSELQLGVASPQFAFAPVRVTGAPAGVSALALGSSHTCVVSVGGRVTCWGRNSFGEVGVQSTTDETALPTTLSGVTARFVVAGEAFTCAGGDSTVWCWGRNLYGELGVPPEGVAQGPEPRPIVGAIAMNDSLLGLHAGGFTVCARGAQGVRCWGRTDLGAIPGPSHARVAQPVPQEVPHYRQAFPTMGYLDQCSVDASDGLRCWGANDLGASGNGTVTRITTPPSAALPFTVQRTPSGPIVGLGAAHACATDRTGVLRCWGARYFGQLGDGRLALVPTPVEVPALRGAVALTAGRAFTCARRSTSPEVICAGLNTLGQLGGSSATTAPLPTTEPVPVTVGANRPGGAALQSIVGLSAGVAHACAVTSTRNVLCWGHNSRGQVSPVLGAANVSFGAIQPNSAFMATSVACGDSHTCAVESAGLLRCWGANDRGESGQATATVNATGLTVPGLSGVLAVTAGSSFTCALTTSGRVECFGANGNGQCGTGQALPSSITLPAERVPAIASGAVEVAAGAQHACARVGSEVWCWGANLRGQLGASPSDQPTITRATRVAGLGPSTAVRVGGSSTCALVAGRAWCWGANHRGQLGDGTFVDRASPVEVQIPTGELVVEIATGEEHACARTASGRVYCWGSNHLAQLSLSDPLWITRAEQSAVRWPR